MNDYFSVSIRAHVLPGAKSEITSFEDIYDLAAAFLAEAGFESFESDDKWMTAYISSKESGGRNPGEIAAEALTSFPMPVEFNISSQFIEGKDWNEEWEKNYFQPILIDDMCVVHSTFHKDVPKARYDIVIDPKMAFGTGHHDTTSQMMRHILGLDLEGKSVIDMGTGTGILAILAKMRGAGEVTGIEIDEPAYLNAIEHTKLNDTEINLIHGDASALDGLDKADYLFANINRNIILQDFDSYAAALQPEGEMLLSGFYDTDIPVLQQTFDRHGFSVKESLVSPAKWTALRISKAR